MSNIAGKAYAINVITPMRPSMVWVNKYLFKKATKGKLTGLITLSLIHYAGWMIISRKGFPRLDPSQPKEDLKYSYMLFFSNFNGSWDQYIDSFTFAIPAGLDAFWKFNIRYPKSVPLTPFHRYIRENQIFTDYYYTAYPMASASDVKSAKHLKTSLENFDSSAKGKPAEQFLEDYNSLLNEVQADLSTMHPSPIVSMAAHAVTDRREKDRSIKQSQET